MEIEVFFRSSPPPHFFKLLFSPSLSFFHSFVRLTLLFLGAVDCRGCKSSLVIKKLQYGRGSWLADHLWDFFLSFSGFINSRGPKW